MRKNRMMRLASALLILTMVTTCAISGTFAKYVTEDSGSDSARVAKWGVEVEVVVEDAGEDAEGLAAFETQYKATDDVDDANGAKIEYTVKSSDKVLAPGTDGDLMEKATISGTPEVAVNVKKEANLTLTGWDASGYYCPLTITVDGVALYGMDYTSAADFEQAVEAKLNSDINYAPNANLAETHSVTWAWAFETGANEDEIKANDIKDTTLGNAGTATIKFDMTVTVTQID